MAICAILIVHDRQDSWILLQQRGPGCPDYVGAWSHTCGYLDYDETLREALAREIHEELGIDIEAPDIKITEHSKNDQPGEDPRQNVTIRYVVEIPKSRISHIDFDSESRGGESGEVSEVKLIKVSDGMPDLEFAFNHRKLTREILSDTRFFPDQDEIKVFGAISNTESGSWGIGGKRVLWSLVKTPRGRVRVIIKDFGIDTYWSENTPESIQEIILNELALRRAHSYFENIKKSSGPDTPVKQFKTDGSEIWMKVSDVLKVIEAGSLGPEDIADPVNKFRIL